MTWLQDLINKLLSVFPRLWFVSPDEAGIRLTLGNHVYSAGPGWYVWWPMIQKVTSITVTPQVVDLRPQSVMLQDHTSFVCGGAVKYRIKDATAAMLKVQDFDQSLQALCLGMISRYFTDKCDDDDYSDLSDYVIKAIKEAARGWGLDIMAVYITDLGPTRNIRILTDHPSISVIPEGEE